MRAKPVVFTDLDGTLLDAGNYSFGPATAALQELKKRRIPVVICSSKTRAEIELYREKLENFGPFISENGGGVFIPHGYFRRAGAISKWGKPGYHCLRLGAKYRHLRNALREIRMEGFRVKGFGDMRAEEISRICGLNAEEARLSKKREFDEPFVYEECRGVSRLVRAITRKGFYCTRGRFLHILGNSDKGRAVSILKGLFASFYGYPVKTIALGDSTNDIPMLQNADYPVLVKKPCGTNKPDIEIPNVIKTSEIGPAGWNEAVMELIEMF